MYRNGLTVFLSAFLLFQVQPIAARIMLPTFGGTAQVWTTCIVFFQLALLVGYLYAHLLRLLASPLVSGVVQIAFAVFGLLLVNLDHLRLMPSVNNMGLAVFQQLASAVGLAFCSLAATGPLVQAWHATQFSDRETYRLYAWSNCGSMLALISYPIAVEQIGLAVQRTAWSCGFLLYIACLGCSVWQSRQASDWEPVAAEGENSQECYRPRFSMFRWLHWAMFAAIGSIILIASTNVLCLEVASHPFLWVLPLTMYLLSFIVAFEKPTWYRRRLTMGCLAAAVFCSVLLFHLGTQAGLVSQLIGFTTVTFFGSFVCHGELYRLRPHQGSLTSFYLAIAAGGAIGGLGTVFVAPEVFNGYFEFHVGLLSCLLFTALIVLAEHFTTPNACLRKTCSHLFVAMIGVVPLTCSLTYFLDGSFHRDQLFKGRNHYGIVGVTEDSTFRRMINGQTNHGGQFVDPERRKEPGAYYSPGSGVEVAFRIGRGRREDHRLNVGVIGLGTGAMLSYGTAADQFRFYEINPMVETVAREYFDYLQGSEAEVVIGDGRIQLEAENKQGMTHQFDLLFVDAFTSDSIPVHLITTECVELYLNNLNKDGILVFHITNQFVDLLPVIDSIAKRYNFNKLLIDHQNPEFDIETRWVLLSKSPFLDLKDLKLQFQVDWPNDINPVTWTDDKAALFPVVHWSSRLRSAVGNGGREK